MAKRAAVERVQRILPQTSVGGLWNNEVGGWFPLVGIPLVRILLVALSSLQCFDTVGRWLGDRSGNWRVKKLQLYVQRFFFQNK